MSKLPLEGVRICDLSYFWSGPSCTAYLGGMGAEVIKVESIQHPDTFRFGAVVADSYWEKNGLWNCTNVNKYGITLDLGRPRGIELLKALVKESDVVIENFAPRVMENFNLSYPILREVRPNIIMVSMPAYGLTGPWRDYVGFGLAFEQSSGLAYLTGYTDGPPEFLGGASDPIVGINAAFAILTALEYRRRTGKGQLIEISQTEVLTSMLGAAVIDYCINNRIWGRVGNRDPGMVPHGVYRCKGDDMWVAIAVSSDGEWPAFCQAINNPRLAQDERFSTLTNRYKNQDALDKLIEEWTIEHDCYEAMSILQKAGVAAGAVADANVLQQDPHIKERGFFQELTRDFVGTQLHYGWPIKFSEIPLRMRPAPTLGEHNHHVLRTILNLSEDEIEKLEKEQIIGTTPLGVGNIKFG